MNYCKNAVYYNTILNLSIKERKKNNYTHINNNNKKTIQTIQMQN